MKGGAGGQTPRSREHPRKDDPPHAAFDVAVAAAVKHAANGGLVTFASSNFQIPHPPCGDAIHTLNEASADLDQVHTEVALAVGTHAVDNILTSSRTKAG